MSTEPPVLTERDHEWIEAIRGIGDTYLPEGIDILLTNFIEGRSQFRTVEDFLRWANSLNGGMVAT